jgi:hypothetical protein
LNLRRCVDNLEEKRRIQDAGRKDPEEDTRGSGTSLCGIAPNMSDVLR